MKRTVIVVATLVVALVLPSSGALAKKPTQRVFDVTMELLVDGQGTELPGLATTCGSSSIRMTGNPESVLRADGAMLEMNVPIGWSRHFDAGWGTAQGSFFGCHGGSTSAADTESFPGALWLTFGHDGSGNDTVSVWWRFDYYWEFREEPHKNPKRGTVVVQKALELFELTSGDEFTSDDPLIWSGDGIVSGEFTVTLFTKTEADGVTNFWKPVGEPTDLSFRLTVTPTG